MPSRWKLCIGHFGRLIVELVEVRPAEPLQLGIGVREDPALEQRIVGELDAGHEVTGVERGLLGLGEEVIGPAIEHHLADRHERD